MPQSRTLGPSSESNTFGICSESVEPPSTIPERLQPLKRPLVISTLKSLSPEFFGTRPFLLFCSKYQILRFSTGIQSSKENHQWKRRGGNKFSTPWNLGNPKYSHWNKLLQLDNLDTFLRSQYFMTLQRLLPRSCFYKNLATSMLTSGPNNSKPHNRQESENVCGEPPKWLRKHTLSSKAETKPTDFQTHYELELPQKFREKLEFIEDSQIIHRQGLRNSRGSIEKSKKQKVYGRESKWKDHQRLKQVQKTI